MSKIPVLKYEALELSGESVNEYTGWPTFLEWIVLGGLGGVGGGEGLIEQTRERSVFNH